MLIAILQMETQPAAVLYRLTSLAVALQLYIIIVQFE